MMKLSKDGIDCLLAAGKCNPCSVDVITGSNWGSASKLSPGSVDVITGSQIAGMFRVGELAFDSCPFLVNIAGMVRAGDLALDSRPFLVNIGITAIVRTLSYSK